MNVDGLDLNLLLVLDAVLSERHVTRAARRLGLSQPAVSNALSRLRVRVGDPLFIRTSTGVTPTEFAVKLGGPVREALALLRSVGSRTERFDAATSRRRFVLSMSDHSQFVLLPELLKRLSREAPGVTLDLRWLQGHALRDALERGEADFAVTRVGVEPTLRSADLFADRYVLLVRKGHPRVGRRLGLRQYAALSHVGVSTEGSGVGVIDQFLETKGLVRNVVVRVAHFLLVPEVVARTDLVAAISHRIARTFVGRDAVRVIPPPFPADLTRFALRWHERTELSPAHRWFKTLLEEAAQAIEPGREATSA